MSLIHGLTKSGAQVALEVNDDGDLSVVVGATGQARNREILITGTRSTLTLPGATDFEITLIPTREFDTAIYATAAAGVAAVATIAGVAGKSVFVSNINAGYGAAGVGTMTITDGVTPLTYVVNTTRDIVFPRGYKGAVGATVTITLNLIAGIVPYIAAGYTISDNELAIALAMDAGSDFVADQWLAEASSGSVDSGRVLIPVNGHQKSIQLSKTVLRLDVIRAYGSRDVRMLLEAI